MQVYSRSVILISSLIYKILWWFRGSYLSLGNVYVSKMKDSPLAR
jgi:hypothetical protein